MKNNTVSVDQASHRAVHMQAAGTPADDEPELHLRTVNAVVKEIHARNSSFSAADSLLPRVTLYDRDRARREVREADSVEHTEQVQGQSPDESLMLASPCARLAKVRMSPTNDTRTDAC